MGKKVVLAISGGVDSSVSAYLLKEQGYQVEAIFMKNWDEDDGTRYCTAKQDYLDAKKVCEQLNIPLSMISFSDDYYNQVFEDFLKELQIGNTPNPDVFCNQKIKFGSLWNHAQSLGADFLATGHYAKIKKEVNEYQLHCAKDQSKDQSYFLYAINPMRLQSTLFPLADFAKSEVRQIAKKLNLSNAKKKDSTGICFIGERKFNQFLNRYLRSEVGEIIDLDEQKVIGEHKGLIHYTTGQRKGLGIGGMKSKNKTNRDSISNQPWFVVDKSIETNQLFVVQGENNPALFRQRLIAKNPNWLAKFEPKKHYQAKIRYRQKPQSCIISSVTDNQIEVLFDQPQRAITTGQAVVLYNHTLCIGGATIDQSFKT